MFPTVDEQRRAYAEWRQDAVVRWTEWRIRPICDMSVEDALAYVDRGQQGELSIEETRQIWEDAFVAALSEWPQASAFLQNGGVPGCRVPETTDYRAVARALREGVHFYKRWMLSAVIGDAVREVESLREADNSYNPDY